MKALLAAACIGLLLGFCHAAVSDFNLEWALMSGRVHQPKCVAIPENMTLCSNIGYKQMRLPNLLDHDNLAEATQQAVWWTTLVGISCHPDTQVFLCSLFSPVCLERVIQPCRSLCTTVRDSCELVMKRYGFFWPEMFRCEKFPDDNDLCMPTRNGIAAEEQVCPACKEPDTYEGIIDNHCSSQFVIKTKVKSSDKSGQDLQIILGKGKKKFYKNPLIKKDNKDLNREVPLLMKDSAFCNCTNRIVNDEYHLIAGYRDSSNDQFYVNFITTWTDGYDTKLSVKKAIRAIKKSKTLCSGGLVILNVHKQTEEEVEKEEKLNKLRTQ